MKPRNCAPAIGLGPDLPAPRSRSAGFVRGRPLAAASHAVATLFALLTLTADARAQAVPPRHEPPDASKDEVSVMSEFKVYDKQPVPFTDANMDIPRGVNDVQPYYIIGPEEIEVSGKTELEDFLKDNLTQNTVSETNAQVDPSALQTQLGATSTINLRGLGSSQTLILVNGQRTSNFANRGVTYQPDMNGIPMAAIERVEVLPGSASAIYGGTAVGGVVNVILKRTYVGGQVSATYQNTFDSDAPVRTLNGIFGFSAGPRTHVTLSTSYSDGKPLRMKDRPFIEAYFKRAITNSPITFYTASQTFIAGATPNIALNTAVVNGFRNEQAQTLTLKATGQPLNSRITYIPYGTAPSTPADALAAGLLANAGKYNLDLAPSVLRGYESTLGQVQQKRSVMARIDHKLNSRVSIFADFSLSRSILLEARWIPIGNGGYQFQVPGNAPTNPFRENVLISFPVPFHQTTHNDISNQVSNGVIGAVIKLPAEWRLAADVNYSVTTQKVSYGLMNLSNQNAFGGHQGLLFTGALNPFVDMIAYPTDITRYYGEWLGYNKDTMLDYNVRASGPLFSLPGGRPMLTVGSELYTERLPQAIVGGSFPPVPPATVNPTNQYSVFIGQRISTYAGHAEVSVPIVSGLNERRFVRALELQAAVRTEYFKVFTNPDGRINYYPDASPPRETHSAVESRQDVARMHATKPTFGLRYQPVRDLMFRVSYATAFLPPTFAQLTQRINKEGLTPPTPTAVFYDPVTNTSYASLSIPGNNPNLGPETSKNWNFGVIWQPQAGFLKDFRFNLEYWKIDKLNLVRNVNSPQLLANLGDRAPAGSVTRNPETGVIELFTYANYNVGDGSTDGWDVTADYRRATRIGTFGVRGRATITEHLKLPPAISFPPMEYVSFVNSGGVNRLKTNGALSWAGARGWRAVWTTVYHSGYKQAGAPGDPVYLGAANPTLITTSTGPQGGDRISSQIYHNVSVSRSFGAKNARRLLKGLTVQVTVNNVFDTEPPFDARNGSIPFFYSRYGSVRLRDYIIRVKRDF